jgi:ubiquinone/menaquinone biosynthesis C-methylase UbiE
LVWCGNSKKLIILSGVDDLVIYSTDTNFLTERINSHKQFSKNDINEWILPHIQLENGTKFLDIGCGTGEQLIRIAKKYPMTHCMGIDISQNSLKHIENFAQKYSISNIKTKFVDIDNISVGIGDKKFDVIISCFALYYSQNIPKLISSIKQHLNYDGKFFVCGPVEGNNKELVEFQLNIDGTTKKYGPFIMTDTILPEIQKFFSNVALDYFYNPISFPDPSSLFNYWKSYILYEPKIEKQFLEKIKKYFLKHKKFVTTKKVMGITVSN